MLQPFFGEKLRWLFVDSTFWTLFGLFGQGLFGSRFIVQWLHSEKHGKVLVPAIFWHLSFWGSIFCLIYAVHLDKLPLLLGAIFLPFIYGRNLMLLRKRKAGPLD